MSESHDTPHTPAAGHDAGHDSHGHSNPMAHARTYGIVGLLLLIFTCVTVWLSYVDFNVWLGSGRNWNIIIAMIVATFKATLVALIFMHLNAEKWTIYRFLLLTVFFVIGLFALSLLAFNDPIRIHYLH